MELELLSRGSKVLGILYGVWEREIYQQDNLIGKENVYVRFAVDDSRIVGEHRFRRSSRTILSVPF